MMWVLRRPKDQIEYGDSTASCETYSTLMAKQSDFASVLLLSWQRGGQFRARLAVS